jgi:hypothetical protein
VVVVGKGALFKALRMCSQLRVLAASSLSVLYPLS